MLIFRKEDLAAICEKIAADRELYIPVKNGGQTNYSAWEKGAEVDLDTLKTVKSGKDAFFPQYETLYTVRKEGKKLKVEAEKLQDREFVVFGMKACDLQGLKVLDRVFLSDPVDTFYAARREQGILVSLACSEPEESCFCKAFGLDAAAPGGDVELTKIGDFYSWEAHTEKGLKLTESVKDLLAEASNEEKTASTSEKDLIRSIIDRLPYSGLSLENWGSDESQKKFDSPVWEKLYKSCLACGTCTFVCPTCQCYDIKDYTTPNGIQRYRCWDSCMYSDFTMMSHGNNRTSQLQRYRQRFMHKLVYYPTNNDGMFSCTGCGRCVEKCPASLNIVKVIKAFEKEAENHA